MNNARDLFELRHPTNKQEAQILLYLVKFYDVQGYQTWGSEDIYDREEYGQANISSQESISVDDAVLQHPDMAVEALSAMVGLIEENFIAFEVRQLNTDNDHSNR